MELSIYMWLAVIETVQYELLKQAGVGCNVCVCVCVCVCEQASKWGSKCVSVCMHVRVSVCVHARVSVCVHAYVCVLHVWVGHVWVRVCMSL